MQRPFVRTRIRKPRLRSKLPLASQAEMLAVLRQTIVRRDAESQLTRTFRVLTTR
jgi:hypothetical protein